MHLQNQLHQPCEHTVTNNNNIKIMKLKNVYIRN